MRYTIEYVNQRIGGEQRSIVRMVFRDKQSAGWRLRIDKDRNFCAQSGRSALPNARGSSWRLLPIAAHVVENSPVRTHPLTSGRRNEYPGHCAE
jgi:hypothetical protein